MKGKTLQACSLKHSVKKGMFFLFKAKLKLFKSGRGGEYSPPLAARLLKNTHFEEHR